ncbi:FtsW/RodA/SpoVE family cell cycle protein [Lactococcus garvieae]|jgi:cell division protein FtsW|uniref:Probable peptidoglycan glycosyltransferase FtsW n=1 Tax=Lactococcus formosensis TaxID=1281486 RepID=A0A9Q8Y388_9LACT|nr:FtsW/RodA/SpoVE family cell cycle protein [Lactococcus formosensis]NHI72858.1 FtsW/RodA/SpoVE family cell cycle protein [Lactococcus garvieae]NHI99406.1 FtsW/RodA/SpoVE family cell cycle protein [Lactococcus garvieae]NHJ17543.1 FtsW/RodA/SpoVE family cell cycle protein [Lactococcus garvieae]USJ20744.1 FtsW/RodA/SpoVE family cell cycle protein [Lactococcus formosensis]
MKDGLKKANFLNYSILIPYLIMSAVGIVMVFSATVPYQLAKGLSPYKMAINQGAFMLLSFVAIAVIYRMKLRAFKSKKMIGWVLGLLVLAMLYSRFGPNTSANGAHGWIPIPGVGTIQPAEYAKFFVVWYLASVFSEKQDEIYEKDIAAIFKGKTLGQKLFGGWRFSILLMLGILVIMPDLGNASIMAMITGVMIASSGISWRWFSGYGKMILGAMIAFIVYLYAVDGDVIPGHYVNARFKAMVNPFEGLSTYGHQMANSYYAVSNGGWFGRGLGNSIEKNGFLPEAHTDFIFSIVIEELGLIGGIIVLGVLFFMIVRILMVGIRAKNAFNSMICIGIGSTLLISVFINIGGAFGIIPETGVTFPFLSQGGSSFLVLSLGIAFVLNISADEKRREVRELSSTYARNV